MKTLLPKLSGTLTNCAPLQARNSVDRGVSLQARAIFRPHYPLASQSVSVTPDGEMGFEDAVFRKGHTGRLLSPTK